MSIERAVFDRSGGDCSDAAADARADADVAAGRVIDHDEVAAWLATWGTPDEKPAPAEWFE